MRTQRRIGLLRILGFAASAVFLLTATSHAQTAAEQRGPPQTPPTEASSAARLRAPATITVRTGQHAGFSRIIFNWKEPVGYAVESTSSTVTISFDKAVEVDTRQLSRAYLKFVRGRAVERVGDGVKVILQIAEGSSLRHMREGHNVVIDVFAPPKTPTPAANMAQPTVASPATSSEGLAQQAVQPVADAPVPSPVAAAKSPPQSAGPAPLMGENGTLRFDWNRPVATALFRRGGTWWCVFDAPSIQDGPSLSAGAGSRVRRIEQSPHDRATVLRIVPEAGIEPRLQRDGLVWIMRLSSGAEPAGEAIVPLPDFSQNAPRLLLPIPQPGSPLAVADPEFGDTLAVVPVIPLAMHIPRPYTYPQLRLLASVQGVVIEPLIDTLRVRSLREGVELSSRDGLAISPVSTAMQAGSRIAPASDPERLLDAAAWSEDALDFVARRQALERSIVESAGSAREQNRLRLAQVLLGRRFAAEALGVLALAAEERPTVAVEPKFLLLRGAARLLTGRTSEARDDLARAAATGGDEVGLWSAATATAAGAPPADLARLPQWAAIAGGYPRELRGGLILLLAEAALSGGQTQQAEQLLELARADARTAEDRAQLAYLDALRKQGSGDVEGALAGFEQAAHLDPRRGRARAELARTLLLRREGRMSPEQAIAALDALRFAWRGDELELRLLREIGRLQLQVGDYPAALRTLKAAASGFPALAGAEIAKDMVGAFERLYLEGAADHLAPVTALALYEEFKELTPPGEKGSALIGRLADRLVQADLLERAASLLEGLLPQSSPQERARLGARLADIRLLDGKAEAALEILRRTATPGLPADLQRQRSLALASALVALGRGNEALTALAQEESLDAELLRAKAFRSNNDWERTATALRRIVDAASGNPAAQLSERQARDILELAVALSLAGSDSQLAKLDQEYGSAMAATPLRDAFRLIAGTGPSGAVDPASLAALVERAAAFRRSLAPAAGDPALR